MGGVGVRWFGQCPKENVFFLLMSSLTASTGRAFMWCVLYCCIKSLSIFSLFVLSFVFFFVLSIVCLYLGVTDSAVRVFMWCVLHWGIKSVSVFFMFLCFFVLCFKQSVFIFRGNGLRWESVVTPRWQEQQSGGSWTGEGDATGTCKYRNVDTW